VRHRPDALQPLGHIGGEQAHLPAPVRGRGHGAGAGLGGRGRGIAAPTGPERVLRRLIEEGFNRGDLAVADTVTGDGGSGPTCSTSSVSSTAARSPTGACPTGWAS
jgi:hypothetical protein